MNDKTKDNVENVRFALKKTTEFRRQNSFERVVSSE